MNTYTIFYKDSLNPSKEYIETIFTSSIKKAESIFFGNRNRLHYTIVNIIKENFS